MRLDLHPGLFAVCRLGGEDPLPDWGAGSRLFSVTRTADELSIVCPAAEVPAGVVAEEDWRLLEVEGPLDLTMVGVLAALASPLAEAGVSIFALSTYDTDYLLVKESDLRRATEALREAGHEVTV